MDEAMLRIFRELADCATKQHVIQLSNPFKLVCRDVQTRGPCNLPVKICQPEVLHLVGKAPHGVTNDRGDGRWARLFLRYRVMHPLRLIFPDAENQLEDQLFLGCKVVEPGF